MVGVPGRSKACHTCKKRKKGCDRQVPICGQCINAGIPCEGYGNTLIFVNSSQKNCDSHTNRFVPGSYAPPALSQSETKLCIRNPSSTTAQNASPMADQSLARGALQLQYFDNFWSCLLPNGQAFPEQATQYSTAGWYGMVLDLCQKEGPVRLALLANALVMLGTQTGQRSLIVEAWRAYGRSLAILARSLPTITEEKGDQLLVTSTLLSQFELLQGARGQHATSASGERWFRHSLGESAITLAKTPNCFVNDPAHQWFVDNRLHLIYPYLRNRKRSPFSSPEWKTIPWSLNAKDPKNDLLDILIELPGLLEGLDELLECPPERTEMQMSLLHTLQKICWQLDSQLQHWSVTSGSSTISFVEFQITCEDYGSPPSSENFAMAHLGLLYWTTCLILYQNLCYLSTYNQFCQNLCNASRYQRAQLPERMEPRQYCRKILMLSLYCQHANMGEFFLNIVAFPAITVMSFLDRHDPPGKLSEERKMLLKAFKGKYRHQMDNILGAWPWRHWKSRMHNNRGGAR